MERQKGNTLNDIRDDHKARYEWVIDHLKDKSTVIDACCGVGYGSHLVAKKGHTVTGIDISKEAIEYAREWWHHPRATFAIDDLSNPKTLKKADVAIAFECVEHIQNPLPLLIALRSSVDVLYTSVPNEDVHPYHPGIPYHYRHYTRGQFESLLNEAGWKVDEWAGQQDIESGVEKDLNGWTIVVKCSHGEVKKDSIITQPVGARENIPDHVSIVGLGPSQAEYTNITKRLGGRHQFCDETWAINALGGVLQCDKIFHMDDVRIQEIRAKAKPESNIASMIKWMRSTSIPIVTSRPHPAYPTTIPFPLAEVLTEFDTGYFNSTAAYAVAYAVWLGVKKISVFGVDFTYPDAHDAEKGRACVEYWLGIASERGIKLLIPKTSTLLDAIHTQKERFYGYDTLDMVISQNNQGVIGIEFTERKDLPNAEQIEESYNHSNHPNALMSEVKDGI